MRGWGWIRARRWTPYDAIRIALGLLLLTAAGFKAHQLATEPVLGAGLLDSRWLLMATVEFELLLGLALLWNVWRRPTWAATVTCFALFACVSLYKGLSGEATCGCLGRIRINPWYTLAFDIAVVFALVRYRPKGGSREPRPARRRSKRFRQFPCLSLLPHYTICFGE